MRICTAVRLKVTATIAGLLASTLLACTVAVAFPGRSSGTERERISLDGAWRFAIDPIRRGEADGFATVAYDQANHWDQVEVPHVWSLDPRWPYTGAAWYRREFTAPPLAGRHARLRFESVFARARVWLNGHLLGAHEGGYTPFSFDVGDALREDGSFHCAMSAHVDVVESIR